MNDLEKAQVLLQEDPALTFAAVKGESVKTSEFRGVRPLMELLDRGETLEGYAAADRIVGRAAALLYAFLGLKELFAEVLSVKAEEVLKTHGIACTYGLLTQGIINRAGDGPCPMEQTVSEITDPAEAIPALRAKLAQMRAQ